MFNSDKQLCLLRDVCHGASWRVAVWCLFAALIINLFCNAFSPFFIPEGAMDPDCFYAEGCAIAHGLLPYRDFVDVKGPLLFIIYTIGYLLTPTRCEGIFLLYVLATWGTLIAFYRTAELFGLNRIAAAAAVAFAACALFSRLTAAWGAQPEHLLVFPLSWSLYCLTAFLKDPTRRYCFRLAWWVGCGSAAAFWLKFNFVLPYVAIIAIAVFVMLQRGRLNDVRGFALRGMEGGAIVCLPFILYFSYYGLWGDFVYSYFILNLNANASNLASGHFLQTAYHHIQRVVAPASCFACVVMLYALYTALIRKGDLLQNQLMRGLLPLFIITYISCFAGPWSYYYIMMAPMSIFLCIDFARAVFAKGWLERRLAIKGIAVFTLLVLLINGHCVGALGWGRAKAESIKIAEIQEMLANVPEPSIVYYDCPDILLGRKAESLPGTRMWMGLPGVSEKCYEHRENCIRKGAVDFVVIATYGKQQDPSPNTLDTLQEGGYEPIPEARLNRFLYITSIQVWAKPETRALIHAKTAS